MENFLNMAGVQAVLFLYLVVGVLARKLNIIRQESLQSFIDFLIKIALPCMIFLSFDQALTPATLLRGGAAMAVSLCALLVSTLLGKVVYRNVPKSKRSIMQYGTLISNAGFAGLPLVAAAYGAEAVFYASVFLIPSRVFMWSSGIAMFTEASTAQKLKSALLNPGLIAVVLGFLRALWSIPLPPAVDTAVRSIGAVTSALSIIVVGAILAEVEVRSVLERDVMLLSAVRLLLLPGIFLAGLRALGVDPLLTATCVVLIGMPVGTTTALLAQRYGADYRFASKTVFVSTVLSLVTVPLLSLFFV